MSEVFDHYVKDVRHHEIAILRDDGVYRHVRFGKPGTNNMRIEVITWPGHLCYAGDMGTYVFTRLEDMFEFFRRSQGYPVGAIDFRYWAEKVDAQDCVNPVTEFSHELFREHVMNYINDGVEYETGWTPEKVNALKDVVESDVFGWLDDGEHASFCRLRDFEYEGFEFTDIEFNAHKMCFHFEWACYAIQQVIDEYDKLKDVLTSPVPTNTIHD